MTTREYCGLAINDLGGAQINPNRTWPGREDGNTVERPSWLITHKLIKSNVDAAIARKFVPEMVKVGVDGNMNVLVHYGVISAPMRPMSAEARVFMSNDLESVRGVAGGFLTLLVKLNDAVTKGQCVAVQRNTSGDVVHDYVAQADGRAAIIQPVVAGAAALAAGQRPEVVDQHAVDPGTALLQRQHHALPNAGSR